MLEHINITIQLATCIVFLCESVGLWGFTLVFESPNQNIWS